MNNAQKFVKNTFFMMIAKGSQPFLSMILAIVISRKLGIEAFGEYNTIFYLVMVFHIFSSFGYKTYITREVAKNTL